MYLKLCVSVRSILRMSIGRLGDFMVKSTHKCNRCGLHYLESNEHCAHCFNLKSQNELDRYKQEIIVATASRKKLGWSFAVIMFFISFFLYLSF